MKIKFETLNFGREGINSTDIRYIVEQEVTKFKPDYIFYYEGSNQFNLVYSVKDKGLSFLARGLRKNPYIK